MESIQQDKETISLKKIIVDYIRYWKLFFIAGCISLVPAILYLIFYPKTYELMSRIQILEDKDFGSSGVGLGEAAGLMKSFGLAGNGGGAINIDDEVATLSSNYILKQVVLELGTNVVYKKSYSFYKLYEESPLSVIPDSITQESLEEGVSFHVKSNQDGSVKVKMEKTGETFSFQSLPAQLKVEEGVFNISRRTVSDEDKSFSINVSVSPASWTAEEMAQDFLIEPYSKSSNVIEISCTEHERMRGKDMLNALMKVYNKNSTILKKEDGYKVMTFLDSRILEVMDNLDASERTIEAYKIKNKMTDIEYDVQFYVDAVKTLREKIVDLEAQTHIIDLLDAYVKDPKNKYSLIPTLLSVGEGDKGGAISTYNEALIEREKLKKSSKTISPLSEIADTQISKLRESVCLSIENTKKSAQYVLDDLKQQEQKVYDKMGNVPTYEREFLNYKRQQEIYQGVYLILLQKKEEIALSLGQDKDKGHIVDAAFVKKNPIAPRKLFAGIFMIIFTLVVPVVYLFCKGQYLVLKDEFKKTK